MIKSVKPARGFAPILIILIVVILGAAGAFFTTTTFEKKPQPSAQTSPNFQQAVESPNPTVAYTPSPENNKLQAIESPKTSPANEPIYTNDGNANWKTYVNNTSRYSIMYPSDWTAAETAPPVGVSIKPVWIRPPGNETFKLTPQSLALIPVIISITVNMPNGLCETGNEEVYIDNVKGFIGKQTLDYGNQYKICATVNHNGTTYYIQFIDKNSSREKLFYQILSTLKFTD